MLLDNVESYKLQHTSVFYLSCCLISGHSVIQYAFIVFSDYIVAFHSFILDNDL